MANTITIAYASDVGGIPLTKTGLNKHATKAELDLVCDYVAKAKGTIKSMRVEFSDGTLFTVEKE